MFFLYIYMPADSEKNSLCVGYHLPFQHNELFHLPYMAVAEINLRISLLASFGLRLFSLSKSKSLLKIVICYL